MHMYTYICIYIYIHIYVLWEWNLMDSNFISGPKCIFGARILVTPLILCLCYEGRGDFLIHSVSIPHT